MSQHMTQEELDRMGQKLAEEVRKRWPDFPVERLVVLQYGDDPEIEPGQLLARIYVEATEGEPDRKRAMGAFHEAHRERIHEMRRELDKIPDIGVLEFVLLGEGDERGPRIRLGGGAHGGLPGPDGPLVPVMARLGPADLETVDMLITAGIAANRADAVRWALARIRERPAYERLRERSREIEELKSQF
ncbi:MAG TPA: hypothetical protein VKV33_05565 [Streptosporangiaceae bacterium]|nr:hypothetical protein [Streptosporangiaceae bacterium]